MHAFPRILLIFALAVAASCGGDEGSGGSPASPSTLNSLAGSWKATKAEFVSASNTSLRVEVVSLGTSLTLTLESGGAYTQKIVDPGQAGQTTTGTWSASSDVLTLRPSGVSWTIQFDMNLSGNSLTLNGGHVAFDLNGDGADDEAIAYLTLARQ